MTVRVLIRSPQPRVASEIDLERRVELGRAIPDPSENYPEDARVARRLLAMRRAKGIEPNEVLEALLADQMIATRSILMECYARAISVGANPAFSAAHLNQAAGLASHYIKQMAALDKHRSKGQQKVVVEYVNVESGGNAVVGNVDARRHAELPGQDKRSAERQ